jgi:hypothetical protein
MRSAITSAKSAIASTRAKPSMVMVKTSPRALGLRPTATMNDEKMLPMPIPEADDADDGQARADEFCRFQFHVSSSLWSKWWVPRRRARRFSAGAARR